MKLYKVLRDKKSCNGGDCDWQPRKWMPAVKGELVACKNGYHLCRKKDLVIWLDEEIWEAEGRGDFIVSEDKVIYRQARILKRVKTWNKRTAMLFAADCAERVLSIFESEHPDDDRPRKAIKSARDYANNKIGIEKLVVAGDAASDAASDTARATAGSAASDAASDAARGAAGDAARAAAWSKDWSVYGTVAGEFYTNDAAGDAVRAAERKWQTKRLFKYLV